MKKPLILIISIATIIILATSSLLLINRDPEYPSAIQSKDETIVQIDLENDLLYFVGDLTQDDLIELIEPLNSRVDHAYYLTNNEHNEKARNEVFSYDVFWVEYKDETRLFQIRTVSSFEE